jgi:hypothetical protein
VVGVESILWGDYAATYGLEDIRSCEPLSNGEFISLLRGFPGMLPHPDWQVELTNLVAAHALLNLLNVKYVLTPPSVDVQAGLGFHLVEQSDLGVVENLDAWPRAFFTDTIVSLPSTKTFIQYLLEHGKVPFAALTPDEITKQPVVNQLVSSRAPRVAFATNYQLLPNSTRFDVHAGSAGVGCLTEGQGRDFVAAANGEPKDVLTVNRSFKGIYLEKPGDYHVEFTYRPRHWRLACGLFWTAIGVTTLLAAALFFFGKFKKIEPPAIPDIPVP